MGAVVVVGVVVVIRGRGVVVLPWCCVGHVLVIMVAWVLGGSCGCSGEGAERGIQEFCETSMEPPLKRKNILKYHLKKNNFGTLERTIPSPSNLGEKYYPVTAFV